MVYMIYLIREKMADDSKYSQNVLTLVGLNAVADFSLKAHAKNDWGPGLALGLASYMGVALTMDKALKVAGVALTSNLVSAGSSLLETLIAYHQGEVITQTNWIGIIFIIVGVFLLK